MTIKLTLKNGAVLLTALVLMVAGIAYGVTVISRGIEGFVRVTAEISADEAIGLYHVDAGGNPGAPLTSADFGTVSIDPFGNATPTDVLTVWVENGTGTSFKLTVDDQSTGDGQDTFQIGEVVYATSGQPLSTIPDPDIILAPGQLMLLDLSLEFSDVVIGDYTLTVRFQAEEIILTAPTPDGLIGWWPGDGDADDVTAHANHGVINGDGTYVPGMVGQAFSFSGAGYVEIPYDPVQDLNHFTIEVWVNLATDDLGFRALVAKPEPRPASLWLNDDKVVVWFDPIGAVVTSITGLTPGQWYHIAGTYDGAEARVYVDGTLDSTAAQSVVPLTNPGPLFLGQRGDNQAFAFYEGLLDEVSIYNRALTAEEVSAIYQAGSEGKTRPAPPEPVPPPAGLIGWWPGDDDADDVTANNNHGTITGDGTFVPGMVGQAFSFSGAGYVEIPHDPVLDLSDFTIEVWVNLTTEGAGYQPLISKGVDPRPASLWLYGDLIEIWFDPIFLEVVRSVTSLTPGNWYHIAATYNRSEAKIYIDGTLDATTVLSDVPSTDTGPLFLGWIGQGNTGFYNGLLDEVSIYDRALTAEEVSAIYEAGSAGKIKPAPPEPVPPPAGMVSWWPGDGNANDIVDANDGTLQDGAGFASGQVDQAFSLDGVNDYVLVPDSASLDLTDQFTLDAWINPSSLHNDAGNSGRIISKLGGAGGNNGYQFGIRDNNGELFCEFNAAGEPYATNQVIVDLPSAIPVGQWSHVVCTYDNADLKIYVDGVLVGTQPIGAKSVVNSASNLRIGSNDNNGSFFHGLIDEVEVFSRALTAAEVSAIYEAGSAGKIKPGPRTVLFVGPGPNGERSDFDIDGDGDIDANDQVLIRFDQDVGFGTAFRIDLNSGADLDINYTIISTGSAVVDLLPAVDRDFDQDVDIDDFEIAKSGDAAFSVGPTEVEILQLFSATLGQLQLRTILNVTAGQTFALRWATPRQP